MWNWMVSALALGTTLVLYDGSPLHPHPAAMWDLVDACKITVFGTSAKWIAVQEDRGLKPRISHNLTTLKVFLSHSIVMRECNIIQSNTDRYATICKLKYFICRRSSVLVHH